MSLINANPKGTSTVPESIDYLLDCLNDDKRVYIMDGSNGYGLGLIIGEGKESKALFISFLLALKKLHS